MLREDGTRFNTNQTYRVSITVNGSAVTVLIDGVQFYSGSDGSLASGSVGMYTWRNSGASFDEIVVRGFAPSADNRAPDIGLAGPPVRFAQSLDTAESVFGENDILVPPPAFQFGVADSAPISWRRLRQGIPIDALLALGAAGGVQ